MSFDLALSVTQKNFNFFLAAARFKKFDAQIAQILKMYLPLAHEEFGNRLDIICLQSDDFYTLVEEVISLIKEKSGVEHG